jgi:hypothetical protein
MMTRILGMVVVGLGVLAASEMVRGEGTATTTQAAPMQISVTGVEGLVQVREASDKPWQKAMVGMTVTEGAEFRTGPRSAVRVLIPPDQTITLDRLGVVKLMQAIQQGNTVKTKVGMPYGRTRYDIEEAGIEHQAQLVTPSSTLAIRGTKVSVYDQPPFAPSAVSLTGRAVYTHAKRQVAFGGKGQGKTNVSAQVDNPGQFSLLQTFVDPNSSFGRPQADQRLINQLQAKGDVVTRNGELAVAFGPAVTDAQLTDIISSQGRFNVSLRWFGPGDFDLFVLTNDVKTGAPYTLGNPSYRGSVFKDIGLFGQDGTAPVTAAMTPDGGKIKFDQVALGGGGFELASWNTPVPQVGYTVAVLYYDQRGKLKNYPLRQNFRVDAFLDGKAVPVLTNFDEIANETATELKFGPTYTGTASLVDSEKILLIDPAVNVKGDVRLTAVDLSPEALDLDGKPIGVINPGGEGIPSPAPAVTRSRRKLRRAATPALTAPRAPAPFVGPVVTPRAGKSR